MRARDLASRDCRSTVSVPRHREVVITAIIAAVLFGIALLMHLANFSLGQLDSMFFMLAGLVAAALHLAGVGTTYRRRVRR